MPFTISTPYRSANSSCAALSVSMLMIAGCVSSMKYIGQLAAVPDLVMRQRIGGVQFLAERTARVLFLPYHVGNDLAVQFLSHEGCDTLGFEFLPDDVAGVAVKEHLKNSPDDFRLVLFDDVISVLYSVTVKPASSRHAFFIELADAPFAVLGYRAAFFLRKGRKVESISSPSPDRELMFSFSNRTSMPQLFQMPHSIQQVHRVPCEPLD